MSTTPAAGPTDTPPPDEQPDRYVDLPPDFEDREHDGKLHALAGNTAADICTEIAHNSDLAPGEICNDGCQEGHDEACEVLPEDCGYSEEEIERLLAATRELGEEPAEVYDPTTEDDTGMDFEEWARQAEPDPPEPAPPEYEPPTPEEPTDEELAEIAPQPPGELSGPALRALKKAWAGYRAARAEDRQAHDHMDKYAEIINGVRAVNGQDPLDFDERPGWSGGAVVPDDPDEEFPAGGGRQKSLVEAVADGTAGVIDHCQAMLEDCYKPMEEWK